MQPSPEDAWAGGDRAEPAADPLAEHSTVCVVFNAVAGRRGAPKDADIHVCASL